MLTILVFVVIAAAAYYLIWRKRAKASGTLGTASPLDPIRRAARRLFGGGPPTQQP